MKFGMKVLKISTAKQFGDLLIKGLPKPGLEQFEKKFMG